MRFACAAAVALFPVMLMLSAGASAKGSVVLRAGGQQSISGRSYAEWPTLATDAKGRAWACWLTREKGGSEHVWVSVNDDGWSAPTRITPDEGMREWPQIACGPVSGPMVVWARVHGGRWFLESCLYSDGGFESPVQVGSGRGRAAHPALTASKDGSYWLAWECYEKGRFRIRLSAFKNGRWGRCVDVTDGSSNAYDAALSADPISGTVWVAWSQVDNGSERAIVMRSCDPRTMRLGPPIEVAVGGKAKTAPNCNGYPSVLCDSNGGVWVAYEQESAARDSITSTCYQGSRECAVACYRDGRLYSVRRSSGGGGGRDVLYGGEDFRPTLARDAEGNLMLFSRMPRPAEAYPKGEARTEYYYRVSFLDGASGWTEPQALLDGSEFTLGDLSKPAVALNDGKLLVAWQADNIRYTGLFANLADFLPVVSRIRVAEVALSGRCAPMAEAVLEPAEPGVRTDLAAIPSECMRGRPPVERRVIQSGGRRFYAITGNLHEHTNTPSTCVMPGANEGTPFDNYRYAADVHGYDFAAMTDHDFGLYYDAAWRKTVRAADFYEDPPYFCALPAYEFSFINDTWGRQFKPARGSQILYFGSSESAAAFTMPDGRVCCQLDEQTNDLNKLLSELRRRGIKDAVLPPHQLTDFYSVTDWDIVDPDYRTVMEIFQIRGSYEYEGCPREAAEHIIPGTSEVADGYERAFAQSALARGQRLGFIAAGDHKSTGIGTTVLFVKEISRKGIIEAMKARRCYATTGDKIVLDFRINGHLMGEEFTCSGKPRITAAIEGTAPIKNVVVFKNNQIIYEHDSEQGGAASSHVIDFVDEQYTESSFYYLRVIQHNDEIAWASPIWADTPVPESSADRAGADIWDLGALREAPLNPEIVSSDTRDGYTAEGIYIDSKTRPESSNRVFFSLARPENPASPVPVYVNLTGGSKDLDFALWLAKRLKCAVADIEWRTPEAEHRSRWECPPGDIDIWRCGSDIRDNIGFALISAARRVLDYLETQPGIDTSRVACGGGSMGGFYSLLAAGVDDRIACVLDAYGAGGLARSGGRIGSGLLSLAKKQQSAWLSAFDPINYASHTAAGTFVYLASNDFFFPLGDGVSNYAALAGDKRLLIVPNCNHGPGAFGVSVPDCGWDWVEYCLRGGNEFPTVSAPRARGAVYRWKASGPFAITRSVLYWSPADVSWPSRYWLAVPAELEGDAWTAALPPEFAALEGKVYVTVFDSADRAVSSRIASRRGIDPSRERGPLWPGNGLWDTERGPAAWRPTSPGANPGSAPESVEALGHAGLRIIPNKGDSSLSLMTNSVVLASGRAAEYRGVRLVVDGCGSGGAVTVSLLRDAGSVTELAYSTTARCGPSETTIDIAWRAFNGPPGAGADPFPFDGLRLDAKRADGSALAIKSLELY